MSELRVLLQRLRGRPIAADAAPGMEALLAEARAEGLAAGLAQGRAEGFAEGEAEGRRQGEAAAAEALAPLRTALLGAAAALAEARRLDPEALRAPMLRLVRGVAERVLMAELGAAGAAAMAPLVEAALARLEVRPVMVRGRPEVLAALEAVLAEAGLGMVPDPGMAGDMVVLEGGDLRVMAGLSARLDDVMAALA